MKLGVRRLVACMLCCGAGLAVSPVVALGEGSPPVEGLGALASHGSALVTSGSPAEGEELKAQEEAELANPNAVAEREASQTKFEGLDAEQAANLAGEAFPAIVNDPAGGPPQLLEGHRITGFLSVDAASIELPEGRHGVLESLAPMATELAPGQLTPIDLGLSAHGSSYQPTTPAVPVSIPKQLSAGVSLSKIGVSLTPVGDGGSPLSGSEGTLDGASVFYANTQTDTDMLVKPTTLGFETDTLLRSVSSPQQLSFKVGLPQGASLVQASDGSGTVQIMDMGVAVATVLAPSARDAAGTVVPVSVDVSGNTLTLTVDRQAGEYQYPIAVDPYVKEDEQLTGSGKPTNWKFCVNYSTYCEHEEGPFKSTGWGGEALVDQARSKYAANETSAFVYQTQGESHIFRINTKRRGKMRARTSRACFSSWA